MKHRWTVRRQFQETLDAQHRWDQAYQLVLAWSSPPVAAAPSLVPLPPHFVRRPPMTTALYARVSTTTQAQNQTLEHQLERLHAYAQAQGWDVAVAQVFRDDGYSGAVLDRPGLSHLRAAIRRGEVTQLCITAPDRLARNYAHQVLLLEEFAQQGCTVTFLERPMTADPHDQLVLQIRGAVAEYERSLIAERTRRGRQRKLEAGLLLPWTHVPFGYQFDPARPRAPAGLRLDPVAAATVAEMFTFYAEEGHSLIGLAKHLMKRGLPTPRGRQRWNQSSVHGILTNPVYTGRVYAGRTRAQRIRRRRSALEPVNRRPTCQMPTPASEWTLIGQVPAIITQEVFDAVQAKMAHNRQFARRNNTAHEYLLRALVSCGLCRHACYATTVPSGHGYYICRGKLPAVQSNSDAKCLSRYIPAEQLDEIVWRDLCLLLNEPLLITEAMQRAQAGRWLPQELQARRETLQKAQRSLAQQGERLTEAYLAGVIPLAEYGERRRTLEQRQQTLDSQLHQVGAQADRQQELAGVVRGIAEFCRRVQTGLEQATWEQKRQLIELLVDRVIVTNEAIEIRYVIPTTPSSEQVRFSDLRSDYHCEV
jgi:site-specific DNA recombinase